LADLKGNPDSPLAGEGVEECSVISLRPSGDRFPVGPITGWWPHGFSLRCLRMETGASIPAHSRAEPEVIFVHEGVLEVSWEEGRIVLGPGDTLSVPVGLDHAFRNTSSATTIAFVVRGSEAPAMPRFADEAARHSAEAAE